MKKLALSLSAAALAITGAGVAYADHHGGKHNPDSDGDGVISAAEHSAHADAMFARLDANSDGVINAEDRAAHMAARAEKREERRANFFAEADANGDGELTAEEMQAAHEARRAERMREP